MLMSPERPSPAVLTCEPTHPQMGLRAPGTIPCAVAYKMETLGSGKGLLTSCSLLLV